MFTQLFARTRNDDDEGTLLGLGAPLGPPAPKPQPKGPLSFRERGLMFIPIRKAHLEYMAHAYDAEAPELDEVVGATLVDDRFLPLGVAVVHLQPSGTNRLFAYFGEGAKWLKCYPKDCLRGLRDVANTLRAAGVFILDAFIDDDVRDLEYLLRWLGAEATEHRSGEGLWYRLDLRKCRV